MKIRSCSIGVVVTLSVVVVVGCGGSDDAGSSGVGGASMEYEGYHLMGTCSNLDDPEHGPPICAEYWADKPEDANPETANSNICGFYGEPATWTWNVADCPINSEYIGTCRSPGGQVAVEIHYYEPPESGGTHREQCGGQWVVE